MLSVKQRKEQGVSEDMRIPGAWRVTKTSSDDLHPEWKHCIVKDMSFLWGHWYFWWWVPAWVSKPGWIPHLHTSLHVCSGFLRFASCMNPADLLMAKPFWSMYLYTRSIAGTRTWKALCGIMFTLAVWAFQVRRSFAPNWHFYDYYSHLVGRLIPTSVYPVHNSANLLRQVQVHIRSFNRSILKITVTAVFEAGEDTHLALQMFLVQTHLVSWWTRLHIVFGWSVNFAF